MGTINKVLDDFISSTLSESIQGITYALETTASGKSKAVQGRNISLSSSQGYKTKVWTELEKAFSDDIYKHCKQVSCCLSKTKTRFLAEQLVLGHLVIFI